MIMVGRMFAICAISLGFLFSNPDAQAAQPQMLPQDKSLEVTVLEDRTLADGTREIVVKPSNVCSRKIDVIVKKGVIKSVKFTGGCSGNTQGVERLVSGMKVEEAIERLDGIRCGNNPTSCPDQLSRTLKLFF